MKSCNAFWLGLFILVVVSHHGCDDRTNPEPVEGDTGTDSAVEEQNVDTAWEEWVGTACTDNIQCQNISGEAGAFCHTFGFCSKGCVPADGSNPQGGCGETNAVCARATYPVPVAESHICVEPCVPEPDGNPCSLPTLTCDPFYGFSSEAMTATCQWLACRDDSDCFSASERCQNDADCLGGTCAGGLKMCLYQGECRKESGRCVFGNPAKSDADIGDPCRNDMECGAGMRCWGENSWLAVDGVPNGYCTKVGCSATLSAITGVPSRFEGNIEFDCGPNAACFQYDQGYCLHRCDPADTTGERACRQGAWDGQSVLDAAGDYECVQEYLKNSSEYSYVRNAGTEAAEVRWAKLSFPPVCLPGWGLGYNLHATIVEESGLNDFNCADYFGAGDTDMQRRDRETGAVVSEGGYCLDNTTSGPSGDWL